MCRCCDAYKDGLLFISKISTGTHRKPPVKLAAANLANPAFVVVVNNGREKGSKKSSNTPGGGVGAS